MPIEKVVVNASPLITGDNYEKVIAQLRFSLELSPLTKKSITVSY